MMNNSKFLLALSMSVLSVTSIHADDTLVKGGQFMDRILPMQGSNLTSTGIWGAANVLPRLVDNGIEDNTYTYWGGNIVKGTDGKYHINVAGWPENSPKGFNTWSSGSMIYHAVSDYVWGPYKNGATVGRGHNPETYRVSDGRYVIYAIGRRYISDSLYGPWTESNFYFDKRGRAIVAGTDTTVSLSNITFARRQDNSFLAVDRGGGVWISKDGIAAYRHITDHTVYNGNRRYLEDPVVWRDSLQYHMIVNDWNARKAYYSRSLDGLHWITEPGTAYEPGVSVHQDGSVELWYKYERPKIYMDESGRASYINFAVIDTVKAADLASDNHSAKNIVLPLNKGLLMEVLNQDTVSESTAAIKVLIKGDSLFHPNTDLNVSSLVFGKYSEVDYGRGAKAVSSYAQGDDMVVTFSGTDTMIDNTEFAPKMIGTDNAGNMVFGYAKLPYVNYRPAILSAMMPSVNESNMVTDVQVENFGLSASASTQLKVLDNKGTVLADGTADAISPYGTQTIQLNSRTRIGSGVNALVVVFYRNGVETDRNTLAASDIAVNQASLTQLVDSANILLNNTQYTKGREALQNSTTEAQKYLDRFNLSELVSEITMMKDAIKTFWLANGKATQTYDFYSWAMTTGTSVVMKTNTVTVVNGSTSVSIPIADYVTDGTNKYPLDDRFAFQLGSRNFNLRNNGTNNASSGLFDFSSDSYFSVLNLNPGDKIIFKITGLNATFVSENAYLESDATKTAVTNGSNVASDAVYVITGDAGQPVHLDLKAVHYTTIKSVTIETETGGVATRLSSLKGNQPKTDAQTYYTMNGMKRNKATKGLFVHNGKTVIFR